jgi:hypothetical protein
VAGLLAAEASPPPVGLIGSDGAGLAVLLNGDVEFAYRDHEGGDQVLSGRDAAAWLDRLLDHLPAQWSLARDGSGAADEWTDFSAGVARADGLAAGVEPVAVPSPDGASAPVSSPSEEAATLLEVPEAQEPPPAPPTVDPPATLAPPEPADDFVSVALGEATEEEAPREPLPIATPAAPAPPPPPPDPSDEPEAPAVQGVRCSRGHFNDPNSPFCATCGISMVQQTHNLVEGPRPPLGVLVLDDGSTYVVDRDIVIGRDPTSGDNSRSITLPDPGRSISRTHARVVLDGWEARVVDAGSANGTFVAAREAVEWTPVQPNAPVPLIPGMHVLVGQRVLSFDSHRRG